MRLNVVDVVVRCVVPVLGLMLIGILGCDSPGKHLEAGQALAAAGDVDGALAKYAEVIDGWPESEESTMASAFSAKVLVDVLDEKLAGDDPLDAARYAMEILAGRFASEVSPAVASRRQSSPELATAMTWLESVDSDLDSRVLLAFQLIEEAPYLDSETRPWLAANLPAAYESRCTAPVAALDDVDDLERLDEIEADCRTLVTFSPESDAGVSAQAAIDAAIPARRDAIKISPAYRTEEAFATCRDYVGFVRGARSRMLSLGRQGRMDELYSYKDRMDRELAGWEGRLYPALQYLEGRLESQPSMDAKASLMRRIERECQP